MRFRHQKAVYLVYCISILLFFPTAGFSSVFYVSNSGQRTSGASTAGNWSDANCYGSIRAAISHMSGGDEVVVDDGTYSMTDNNYINCNITRPPNGSPSQYTIIRARNTLNVRVEAHGNLGYYDLFVNLDSSSSYIQVDGFVYICTDSGPIGMFSTSGTYTKITNCIAVRKGGMDDYGSCFTVQGDYNLIENCSATGHTRYLFETGGPSSSSSHNIFRRCVARTDYSDSNQPMAGFCHYGNDTGTRTNNVLWQNCIAIDGNQCNTGRGSYSYVWGGFYFPKNAYQNTLQGCIVLNQDSAYGGFVPIESDGGQLTLENCVSWGNRNSMGSASTGINLRGSGDGIRIDHCTFGDSERAIYNSNGGGDKVFTNNLFWMNNTVGSIGEWTTNSHNGANPSYHRTGTASVTANKLSYPLRIDPDSSLALAAADGLDIGANVLYAYGRTGTCWGETGYDKLQNGAGGQSLMKLWPWPNEDKIKAVFRETNNPIAGASPSVNNTKRGFCADGKQLNGVDNVTLTSYIWEYMGTVMLSDVYSGTIPFTVYLYADPQEGEMPLTTTLTAYASSPDGAIIKYEWDFDGDGQYDQTTTASSVIHSYDVSDSCTTGLRVTDAAYNTRTASIVISAVLPVVPQNDVWKYRKGTSAPPYNWNAVGFNDSSWQEDPVGIGYGDGDDETILSDMQNNYLTFYARKTFTISGPVDFNAIYLKIDYDDGFVAYINGYEVARADMPDGTPTYTTRSTGHEAGVPVVFDLSPSFHRLRYGTNVVAFEIHNNNLMSSDCSFIPEIQVGYIAENSEPASGNAPGSGNAPAAPKNLTVLPNN